MAAIWWGYGWDVFDEVLTRDILSPDVMPPILIVRISYV
jgi:hypothetical protein